MYPIVANYCTTFGEVSVKVTEISGVESHELLQGPVKFFSPVCFIIFIIWSITMAKGRVLVIAGSDSSGGA
jgi:hypothetical protein